MKILVMSSDNAVDTFMPFHYCIEKYGPEHPEIIYSTESVINPYYKTINKNYPINKGSRRVYDTIKEIDDNHILLMLDDIFIRSRVNNDRIMQIDAALGGCIASINFEGKFDSQDQRINNGLAVRRVGGMYHTSVMCNLFAKDKMLEIFNRDLNPGAFEAVNPKQDYLFLITLEPAINFGKQGKYGGIFQGQGSKECYDFLSQEGLKINSTRPILNKNPFDR